MDIFHRIIELLFIFFVNAFKKKRRYLLKVLTIAFDLNDLKIMKNV